MIYEVIVDISNSEVDKVFDYSAVTEIPLGSRVLVPFGARTLEGFVIGKKETSKRETKDIINCLDDYPVILPEMLVLMDEMVKTMHLRRIDCLRLFIPSHLRGGRIKELFKSYVRLNIPKSEAIKAISVRAKSQRAIIENISEDGEFESVINSEFGASAVKALIERQILSREMVSVNRIPYKGISGSRKSVELTGDQRKAVDAIINTEGVFLLHGVTGSGKTEVYMTCIEEVLKRGQTAIMLVPEISLTPQMLGLFRVRFGENVSLLHSGLSVGERFDEWRRLINGESKVALGARSAIFAPLKNLGIIIIDEEHETSYVSESNPRYFTHDIALIRRWYDNAKLVLGSATPSLDSYQKAKCGEYKLLSLKNRINEQALPDIEVVDMRSELFSGNLSIFSKKMITALKETLEQGNQVMLFVNRRGFASFLRCRKCGYVPTCTDCAVSLTYHKEEDLLKCHYCGKKYYTLTECPKCGNKQLIVGRIGTEKVVEEINRLFPNVKTLRMDFDTTGTKDAYINILTAFANGEAQVLVGTQMIAKGHDFKNVTLVGILDADLSLYFADYRSVEKTFQLITQVAGRAGRDKKTGSVIMQTYNPKHYVFRYATNYDYEGFFDKEINVRELTKFPPFTKIIRILFESEDEEKAMKQARLFYVNMREVKEKHVEMLRLQAMRAPIKKKNGRFRFQVVIWINGNEDDVVSDIYEELDKVKINGLTSFVEINPTQMS